LTTTLLFPATEVRTVVSAALQEDRFDDDVTTAWSVPEGLSATAEIRTRQAGVAAGIPLVAEVFARVDPRVVVRAVVADGSRVVPGEVLVELAGPARSLITAERTVLNFLQRLCGIATLTDRFVEAVAGLPTRILDTRKTAPGLRALDKYAVTAGGGTNHRQDLAAMALVKENHVAAAGGVSAAVAAIRRGMAGRPEPLTVVVEVQTVAEAAEAMAAGVTWLLLDNMGLPEIQAVVALRAGRDDRRDVLLEASGTVTVERVRAIAAAGVDFVSVGALTHSAPALDLTMMITGTAAG
jgi:nicotinate-nucleotide pyrophosphorylase (carboxylating)